MTQHTLQKARVEIRRELEDLDLWTPKLSQVKVKFSEYGMAPGWFWFGRIVVADKEAHWLADISARLLGLIPEAEPMPNACRQTLRHEYGHALWWAHSELLGDEPAFTIFGYGERKSDFVTEYASTEWREDFAETFAFYVRRRGRMPKFVNRSDILWLKWKSIALIPELIHDN